MSGGELSLFGDDPEEGQVAPATPARTEGQIAPWLVDSVRDALTKRGLLEMSERQEAIQGVIGRPVDSIRSLTRAEALRVLSELTPGSATASGPAASWEQREGDTWIDRI